MGFGRAPAGKDAPHQGKSNNNNNKRPFDSDEDVEATDVGSFTKSPPRPGPKAMPVKKARTETATTKKPTGKDATQSNNKRPSDSDEDVQVVDLESPIKSPPRPRPKAMPVKKGQDRNCHYQEEPL